ncbi:transglutaminase family protein [Sphingomonas sp.]|uniref:transglutaminase family protein n=1 Tax=Sphingomonas sp. TaxID=28214 RepID=UPI003B008BAA
MRLTVDHRTTYRFTVPQARVVQLLRLTPGNTHDQTVASWRIHIDCDARMRDGLDGFGNAVTMLYAEGPLTEIVIAVHGEVLTSHSAGCVLGVAEPLPPPLFLRATAATAPDATVARWAGEVAEGTNMVERLHALNRALHDRFGVDRGRGDPGLTAGEAFARESVTPRDLAQLFCVAARSLGIPARFVSGYHLWEVDGEHRPAPHGWAEAHVVGLGWIGFDPTNGMSPEEEYVRVAVALDAAGAAPVAGSRLGQGAEELDVDVSVTRGE